MTTTPILIRGVFKGGCFLSCLYPPLTRKNMDTEKIDVRKLEKCFLDVDAECRSLHSVIRRLEDENKHLRQVIEMLITSKSPSI